MAWIIGGIMENTAQQPPKKTKILNYINVFRGLAILLIIMGHTMQFGDSKSIINMLNCEMICGVTALFIFISSRIRVLYFSILLSFNSSIKEGTLKILDVDFIKQWNLMEEDDFFLFEPQRHWNTWQIGCRSWC